MMGLSKTKSSEFALFYIYIQSSRCVPRGHGIFHPFTVAVLFLSKSVFGSRKDMS